MSIAMATHARILKPDFKPITFKPMEHLTPLYYAQYRNGQLIPNTLNLVTLDLQNRSCGAGISAPYVRHSVSIL